MSSRRCTSDLQQDADVPLHVGAGEASIDAITKPTGNDLPCDCQEVTDSGEREHSQSLRSKLVLGLALMLSVVVGIDEFVRQKVIAPEFANLERVAALKDTNRVLSAMTAELEFLAESAGRDATWVTTHWETIGQSPSPPVLDADPNIALDLRDLGNRIKWAAVVDQNEHWRWLAEPLDEPSKRVEALSMYGPQRFPDIVERLRDHANSQSTDADVRKMHGITRSSDGVLYLFAALPLDLPESVTGDPQLQSTNSRAFYVVGRHCDDEFISDIQQRTSVTFSISPIDANAGSTPQVNVSPSDQSQLIVRWPLSTSAGQPLAELKVQLPRDITNRSSRTTAFARYLSLCGTCLSLLLLLLLLQRMVIGRLETIRQHTDKIARLGVISAESDEPVLQRAGRDEIGQLAQSFDRMRSRLGDAQRRLSDASHAAGMSLVADTVIHNVGNVLTNVNSLIETASCRVDQLRIEPLQKLATRLRDDQGDEALFQATPDYLHRLSQTLEDDKDELAGLLNTLNENVQHIHQVIQDQRRHANQPVKLTQHDLRGLIDEAIRCSQAKLDQDDVRVTVHCDADLKVWTDRSLILQVLINVISNAGNATRTVTQRQPSLQIDTFVTKSHIHVRFKDNGCGMDQATLQQAFDAHFTTRQSGSGLGLHFCAIAMKRLGGEIHAESDGRDRGSTFSIEIPTEELNIESQAGESSMQQRDDDQPVSMPQQQ